MLNAAKRPGPMSRTKIYEGGVRMNTRIEYMYRDGENFKEHYSVVLGGEISKEDVEAILKDLPAGEGFIPGVVGLPSLEPEDADNDIDGPWHEILSIEPTEKTPDTCVSASEACAILKSTTREQWEAAAAGKYEEMFGECGGVPGM